MYAVKNKTESFGMEEQLKILFKQTRHFANNNEEIQLKFIKKLFWEVLERTMGFCDCPNKRNKDTFGSDVS